MMHAYDEIFLRKAMINTGDIFDFAINGFGLGSDDFVQMFLCSDISRRLETGDPKFLIGMSGIETALQIIEDTSGIIPEAETIENFGRSPDYWCGWALCYYQWLKAIPYKEVFRHISYDEISAMYPTLHEADVSKFADAMDGIRRERTGETKLKIIRTAYGCSQSRLAKSSGVSLRSIQMYEQRNKDINKGQVSTLQSLAGALGCRIEDLLEA